MTNILFVSIGFPPKNDPECLQTARYFKYLSRDKSFVIDVVTSRRPTLFMPEDTSLEIYDTGYRQLVEIKLWESKVSNYAFRKTSMANIFFPDSKMTFHWQWKKAVKELSVKPDLIYSRSNPMSSAFMAWKLKKYFNVPWVMHMSDPWAISPLEDVRPYMMRRALAMETELINKADKVTFTTQQTLELYAARHKEYSSRFSVLPNVYDPDDIREVPWSIEKKLRIVYTGGLAGKRNVFFLDEVLKKMFIRNTSLEDDLEFIFAGDMDRDNRAFFGPEHPCLKHRGILSHKEAKSLCESAHLLLVVDSATSSENAVFFPSKLLDYFLVKRKIWAITPPGSATRDILKDGNHIAHHHSETDAMVEFLFDCIQKFKAGELSSFESNIVPEAFNAEKNAKILSTRLKEVVQ